MAKKRRAGSRILEAIHEGALGLFKTGFIDRRRMQEFDALCLTPVPIYSKTKIRALRSRYHLSHATLAALLNTSVSTVRQWEVGRTLPRGPSLKLLNLLDRKGIDGLM